MNEWRGGKDRGGLGRARVCWVVIFAVHSFPFLIAVSAQGRAVGVGTESGREMGRERDRERRRTRNLAPTWVRRRRARRERSRLPRAAYSFLFSLCARVARGWREKERETSTLGHAHIHPVSLAAMVRNGAVRARRVVTRDETPAPHPLASVFLSQTSLPLFPTSSLSSLSSLLPRRQPPPPPPRPLCTSASSGTGRACS